jgi:hypothetical protein
LIESQNLSERFTHRGETIAVNEDFEVYINGNRLGDKFGSLQEAKKAAVDYIETIRSSGYISESILLNKKFITLNSGEVMSIDSSTQDLIESLEEDKYKTMMESKSSFMLSIKELRKTNV